MKILFMFFALLNAGFFIWQADVFSLRAPSGASSQIRTDPNVPQLTLLRDVSKDKLKEKEKKPKAKEKPKPKTQVAKADSKLAGSKKSGKPICYALGPFDGLPQAKNIATKLQDLGAFTNERSTTTESPMGFWVYLKSSKSWKDAKEKVIELEKQGIKDMFIVGRGAMKNAVSLGLYKNKEGAQDRINQLKKLGEKPKIQTQYKQLDQYWIDIDVEAGQDQVINTIEKIAQSLTVLELNNRKCD
ncbi:SPOR domain-containing protein [Kaarinaea lacus]